LQPHQKAGGSLADAELRENRAKDLLDVDTAGDFADGVKGVTNVESDEFGCGPLA
jgi:hypothetical protein